MCILTQWRLRLPYPEDGGSGLVRDIDTYTPKYTASLFYSEDKQKLPLKRCYLSTKLQDVTSTQKTAASTSESSAVPVYMMSHPTIIQLSILLWKLQTSKVDVKKCQLNFKGLVTMTQQGGQSKLTHQLQRTERRKKIQNWMELPLLKSSEHRNFSVAPNTEVWRRKRGKKGRKETEGEETWIMSSLETAT
jgi:hypothetical protein